MKIVSVEIDNKKAQLLNSRGWSFDWSIGATDLIANHSELKAVVYTIIIKNNTEQSLLAG
jgi:hypothetical protein